MIVFLLLESCFILWKCFVGGMVVKLILCKKGFLLFSRFKYVWSSSGWFVFCVNFLYRMLIELVICWKVLRKMECCWFCIFLKVLVVFFICFFVVFNFNVCNRFFFLIVSYCSRVFIFGFNWVSLIEVLLILILSLFFLFLCLNLFICFKLFFKLE